LITLSQLIAFWHAFFHEPMSLFPLAVFRCCFGGLVFLNAILLLRVVPRHLAPDAIFTFARYERSYGRRRFTLQHLLPPTAASVYFVPGMNAISGITLSLGLATTASAVVCFMTLVSIHHRNPAIFHGGDTVMRLMSFLLMFSPAGNGWSVDAMLHGHWEAIADPWCLRLMQIQVSIIYLRNVFWKLRGEEWRNGTAIWYTSNCDAYVRFRVPRWLLSIPMMRFATWSALAIEFSLGTLIWISEFRMVAMLFGIALHLILEVVMNLQLFGYVMIACLLLFL